MTKHNKVRKMLIMILVGILFIFAGMAIKLYANDESQPNIHFTSRVV